MMDDYIGKRMAEIYDRMADRQDQDSLDIEWLIRILAMLRKQMAEGKPSTLDKFLEEMNDAFMGSEIICSADPGIQYWMRPTPDEADRVTDVVRRMFYPRGGWKAPLEVNDE
jgi:hypothetical protein